MGFFSGLAKAAKAVVKSPIGKAAASFIPGAATAYTAYEIGSSLLGGSKKSAPALPPPPGGMAGPPALPGQPGAHPSMGKRSIFRDDPNVIEALKPYAIPARDLKTFHRAPRGFVVVYDQVGDPYGLPKQLARAYGLWKPAARPPISATDWKAFKRAASVGKKLKSIESMSNKYLTRRPSRSAPKSVPYQIIESGPGGVKVGRGKVR